MILQLECKEHHPDMRMGPASPEHQEVEMSFPPLIIGWEKIFIIFFLLHESKIVLVDQSNGS